jgi:hypothetical protein
VAGATVAALGAAGALSAGAFGSSGSTTVFLVSNQGADITPARCQTMGGCGPVVTAPVVLAAGQQYKIHVNGTISVWSNWPPGFCGHPLRARYPTPGPNAPTSDDAVFRFAIHLRPSNGVCAPLPRKTGLFQINLGSGWFSPTAVGNPTKPSRDHGDQHPYTFVVIGHGAQPRFRYVDNHPSDNSGKLKIVVSGG